MDPRKSDFQTGYAGSIPVARSQQHPLSVERSPEQRAWNTSASRHNVVRASSRSDVVTAVIRSC